MLGVLSKLLYLLSVGPFSAEGFPTEGGERLGGNDHRNSNSNELDGKMKDSSKDFSTHLLTKDQDQDDQHPLKIMAFPRLDFQSKSPNSLDHNRKVSHRIRKRGLQFTLDFSKPFEIDLTKRIFKDAHDSDEYEDPYEFESIKKLKLQLAQAKKKVEDAKPKSQPEPEVELLVDTTEMKSFKIYRDITMLLLIHSSVLAIFSTWDYFQNSDLAEWQTYAYYGKRIAAFYWLSTLMFAYAHLLTEEGDLYMIKVWTGLGVISFATAVIFTVLGSEDWEEFHKTEDKPHSSLFLD